MRQLNMEVLEHYDHTELNENNSTMLQYCDMKLNS
jgi:hypothetical protein